MSNHDRGGPHTPGRDAALERAWREASDEQPTEALDAAILAAARRAVPDRPQPSPATAVRRNSRHGLAQWQPFAVAASVAGLAFVLVQWLPREQGLAPSLQRNESPPAAVESPPGSSQEQVALPEQQSHPSSSATPAPPTPKTDAAAKATGRAADAAGSAAEGAGNVTEATIDTLAAPAESREDRRQPVTLDSARRAPATAAAAPAALARENDLGQAVPLDATAWAARIVALHAARDLTAAEDELRAFRAAIPDADGYLPDSLRDWAGTVQ